MEDVLDVYCEPYDPDCPVVCMDETNKQLVAETRVPVPAQPCRPASYDYEYERCGTANLFLFTEPLGGWRHVNVTERRTAVDWAYQIQELLDVHYPTVRKVRLVMDNLNTHTLASLYETFDPVEARRLAKRLDIHYTPKHGSWLNVAEIEMSVLSRQCLSKRIADPETLKREVKAWQKSRNRNTTGIDWQFTAEDARIKLKRLYPHIKN